VHILHKFLPLLQITNSLVSPVFLSLQLDDTVLDLGLLIFYFLRLHDGVHHRIVRFLAYN